MGGIWERQICTVHSVLSAILQKNSAQLDDESLRTYLCQCEAVINNRPLTVTNLNDPSLLEPLTPSHLLTLKSRVVLPPPGMFPTSIQEKDGEESSTCLMSSGAAGGRSSF